MWPNTKKEGDDEKEEGRALSFAPSWSSSLFCAGCGRLLDLPKRVREAPAAGGKGSIGSNNAFPMERGVNSSLIDADGEVERLTV